MGFWGHFFAAATLVMGVAALFSWQKGLQVVATMLCYSWCACALMRFFYVDSTSLFVYVWIDAVQASLVGVMFFIRPRYWIGVVALSLYTQSALHLGFWAGKASLLPIHISNYRYTFLINVLYSLQLTSVFTGSIYIIGKRLWRWYGHSARKLLTRRSLAPI
ncbi:hypothetical protein CcrC1_gp266c [Caulobacter phage C1]|nr:hypothetical protein CcrC1_gp266c [Caulobacter phage C1]UTU08495.1 hypothetical protein CcrC2_gp267c [Caulobacter phage C2]UTU10128.1 hypothetical protein CcrRB23_gp266c [Caulobacter phage RB23]WGN97162.1 hypothetical protein [Bertelyvirus sp.]WGN97680.1 hypothetical protein [Bertelyvirus sp.]